jgi:hypothetical protein
MVSSTRIIGPSPTFFRISGTIARNSSSFRYQLPMRDRVDAMTSQSDDPGAKVR